ncbi:MAG: hypothetical protein FWH38_07635 [Treponema sp.]|nr:hypothetical protein [Treponema sp.]
MFRGSTFPLACFSGAGLLITASDRLAHAITAFGALIWVFCLLALAAHFGVKIFPRRGRSVLLVFLASFIAGIFLFLLWLLSPLCAMESFFTVSLVPLFCMVSGIYKRLETLSLADTLFVSFSEALVLGILIIIFALIREPIGFLSLSLPGGAQGIVLLFSFETESFLPVRLVAGSSGALLLLGYILGLYRYIKSSPGYREEGK